MGGASGTFCRRHLDAGAKKVADTGSAPPTPRPCSNLTTRLAAAHRHDRFAGGHEIGEFVNSAVGAESSARDSAGPGLYQVRQFQRSLLSSSAKRLSIMCPAKVAAGRVPPNPVKSAAG